MATIRASGFYGDDASTYYVTEAGRTWLVQSEDDLPEPRPVAGVPDDAEPCGHLVTPEEAVELVAAIEAAEGD